MAIKALLFDVGGVLLQHPERSDSTDRTWETRHGLQEGDIFKFVNRSGLANLAARGELSPQEVWKKVGERFKLAPELIQEFATAARANEIVNTELAEFLKSIRSDYKTATLSNAWPGTREALTQQYGLDKMVDSMLFSYEEGVMKPAAKLFLIALHRLKVEANEVIYLDNKIINIDGATLAGMQSILFKDNTQAITDINKCRAKYAGKKLRLN